MSRIRPDLQIERGNPEGNKVLAKPDGQTEVVHTEPYKVSPTTWPVNSASIYENTPGQYEIPSLVHVKDVDTAFDETGRFFKWNPAGYFELVIDLSGSVTALQPGDNVSELTNDAGYVDSTGAANAAPVQSVNGETGTVVLDANDVGAIDISEKGSNNGVATLDGGGKIPATQLPNSVMTLEGQWDASTNTPTLQDGTGNAGMVYEVTVAGTQDLGSGNISFNVGDFVVYGNDGKWYRSINSNEVVSVNGQKGVVLIGFNHLTSHPTTLSGYGILDAATAAQGAKADTALQPGDLPPPQDLQSVTDAGNETTKPIKFRNAAGRHNSYEMGDFHKQGDGNIGTIVIRFNNIAGNSMIKAHISVYTWNNPTANGLDYMIKGYAVSNNWYAASAKVGVSGSADEIYRIRLATDGNNKQCILIGEATTSWSRPHVSLNRLETVYSGVVDVSDITIDQVTDESEFTNIREPAMNENISVDMVDGYHASDFATASQGSLADSAVQPGDLATVATTGSSTDLSDASDIVRNNADSYPSEQKINQIVTLTQAEYDAIVSKDPNTMYVIPEI